MNAEAGILGGCIVPHPPLLVPDIGGRDVETVRSTREAMERLGSAVRDLGPDVLVMISPHTPIFRDAFTVKVGERLEGSFASFGCPQVRISKRNDVELARAMVEEAESEGLPLVALERSRGGWLDRGEELDHGLLVPLYYLDQYLETPIISLSISGLDYRSHFHLGRIARAACLRMGRKAVFVASGDLSHRLTRGAPAGYHPLGSEFDRRIVDIARTGDFDSLYLLEEDLVEAAGECGLRSIHALWGALKDGELENHVLSYEGPFGVGYLVSLHLPATREVGV
ncbi:class III extradiol dioxygenase subunit B-like domain-containing protein [Candidatus Solincola tengchongensis]|uniref:class III extradiol dioxygenase subunit B-like domain-containing protein n=1 Tax=Candidatus Solincola tengchongensis TaxID=2900693 RepID=UPI002580DDBE